MSRLFNRSYLDFIPQKPKLKRSSDWNRIREQFIKEMGFKCSSCGKTTNLEVHHIIPVHVNPSMELDLRNLIVLCENKSIFCHFVVGHNFSWRAYNPHVREDADLIQERIRNRLT